MTEDQVTLFGGKKLSYFLEERHKEMCEVLDEIDIKDLNTKTVEEWCVIFKEKERYTLEVPKINKDKIQTETSEAKVPVQQFGVGLEYRPGNKISFFIPFNGNKELFTYQPTRFFTTMYSDSVVMARIMSKELIIEYTEWHPNPNNIRNRFYSELDNIQDNLRCVEQEVKNFNGLIITTIKRKIEERIQQMRIGQEVVKELGFPLKRRDNDIIPTIVPEIRRKITIPEIIDPVNEPLLRETEYNDILSLLHHMSLVIERNPNTFHHLKEEDIRNLFLVTLNAVYEGQATGETFNGNGKTDILIRCQDKNIFIGECKIWDGSSTLTEAITQLLGYATFRDTKTAILMFSKNKDFSSVLKQITDTVQEHKNHQITLDSQTENEFRFKLHQRDDENRELFMTVLVFDMGLRKIT